MAESRWLGPQALGRGGRASMERGRMGTASLALAVGSCNVADGTMAAGRAANRIWRIDWMRGGEGGIT